MPPTEATFSLDWSPDAILVTAVDGSIVYVNPRAESVFGYRQEELLERPIALLIPEGLPTGPRDAPLQQLSRSLSCLHRDGTRFAGAVRWRPAAADTGEFVVVSIRQAEGVAERGEPAELLQQRDFFPLFSHDVRQSLQSIQFICDTWRDSAPEAAATIGEIVESVRNLLDALTRLDESGSFRAKRERCALRPLLEGLGRAFMPVAQRKGIALSVESVDEEIRTDPILLREVLQNLLSNAIRYTHHGEVRVRCHATVSSVRIEVSDTGIGMDAEQLARFSSGATGPKASGSGLGLTIARRLADLLGYRIDATSTPGQGSTFVVTASRTDRRGPMQLSARRPPTEIGRG